ncbi:phage portal protein, partial [Staphylococcus aureus]
LPPVEGGDKPLISGDLYPIDTPLELMIESFKGSDVEIKNVKAKYFSNEKKIKK